MGTSHREGRSSNGSTTCFRYAPPARLNLMKTEQLGSGAVYCQIIDVVHPGKIVISKVNWKVKSDYQFMNNYRLLQDAFNKVGIKRYIEAPVLISRFKNWPRRNTRTALSLRSGSKSTTISTAGTRATTTLQRKGGAATILTLDSLKRMLFLRHK